MLFLNKAYPKDILYKYYAGDNDFIDIIISLKKIIIFKLKNKSFESFIFYTKRDNII